MLNLLLPTVGNDVIDRKVRKVFDEIEKMQSESPYGNFSEHGVIEPFLLLCLLQNAVDSNMAKDETFRRVRDELMRNWPFEIEMDDEEYDEGFGDDEVPLKEDSNNRPEAKRKDEERRGVLRLKKEDVEHIIGPVLSRHFSSSIRVFDLIAGDMTTEYTSFVSLEDLCLYSGAEIFSSALRLSYSVFGDEKSINPTLAEFCANILGVEDGMSFLDFLSGTGLSTSLIIGNKHNVDITLSDRNGFCTDYASIYSDLAGIEAKIRCSDFQEENGDEKGRLYDRIFINPAAGEKSSSFSAPAIRRDVSAAVLKAARLLEENGKAVVVLNSNFAFGSTPGFRETRRELVEDGWVSSVILLPSLFQKTIVPTLVLVLTKERNDSILMVDWTDKEKNPEYFYYEKKYMALVLRKEAEEKLKAVIENRSGDGSCLVSSSVVRDNDFNLLPSRYVGAEKKSSRGRSVADIEEDIVHVLARLEAESARLRGKKDGLV